MVPDSFRVIELAQQPPGPGETWGAESARQNAGARDARAGDRLPVRHLFQKWAIVCGRLKGLLTKVSKPLRSHSIGHLGMAASISVAAALCRHSEPCSAGFAFQPCGFSSEGGIRSGLILG